MRTVADRQRFAAYHNKHCWRAFPGYQHRWPWTTCTRKRMVLVIFFRDFRLEMDPNNMRMRLNPMLSRVSWVLAQIYCFSCPRLQQKRLNRF